MKKHIRNIFLLIGSVVLNLVLCLTLMFSVMDIVSASQIYYPEPDVRPNVPADAVWDAELGMYVRVENNTTGDGALGADEPSPEDRWLTEHQNSTDEIDQAIMRSIALSQNSNSNKFLSSVSPRDSVAIQESMSGLSAECYPELWRQACEEPAFRAQKLIALEMFLGISFDDLGLYDATAQKIWYESFLNRRAQLQTVMTVSESDVSKYGNLLLPMFSDKAEKGTLSNDEKAVFLSSFASGNEAVSLDLSMDVMRVVREQEDKIQAINQILNETYEWVA